VRLKPDYEKAMASWKAKMVDNGHGDFIDKLVKTPDEKAVTASTGAKK
jgi:major membrane immunogen (membrane-anchored lipoprotein)